MADTVIENLITKLSFDFDEGTLEKFEELVADSAKALVAVVAGATAAATAIFAFTQSIAESNDELGKFAQRIGVDLEALQELGLVAEFNGGSIDSMNNSLANLTRIASETARGIGGGVETFGMLGISVTDASGRIKDADNLFLDVADSISRLRTQAERLEFAQRLGIGPDLLLALQQGSDAIREQREEAKALGFVIDKDAADAAANFNDEMLRLTKIVTGVSNAIGTRLIKQIEPMLEKFVEWFKVNKAIIQQNISFFLDKLITTIRVVFSIGARVVGMVSSLVSAMGGWQNSIIAVTALLVTMNANALLMPVLAVAAGAGILLILEDIIKFAEGGDSAIGNLAERFPVLGTVLTGILNILGMVRDGWILIFTEGDAIIEGMVLLVQDLRSEFKLLDLAITGIMTVINMVADGWKLIFSSGGEALEGLLLMLKDFKDSVKDFLLVPLDKVVGLVNKIPGINIGATGLVESATEPIVETVNRTQIIRDEAGNFMPQPQVGGATNTTTNNPVINISIDGGNVDEVRRVVSEVLSEQYSGAQTNLKSQVEF